MKAHASVLSRSLVRLLPALFVFALAPAALAGPLLQSSVLPTSRAGKVGDPVTYFASIINAGDSTGTGCLIRPHAPSTLLASFSYQAYQSDGTTPAAAADTPIDIASGATQLFVITFTPSAGIGGEQIALDYVCMNGTAEVLAPRVPGVNTPVLSATFSSEPDIITIGATPTGDGIVNVPNLSGLRNFESFSVSAVNIGPAAPTGPVLVTVDTGTVRRLGKDRTHSRANGLRICESDPATGLCITPFSPFLTSTFSGAEVHTYVVLLTTDGRHGAPLFADMTRMFVRFALDATPSGGTDPVPGFKYGATSVAYTIPFTTGTAPGAAAQGVYDVRYQTATNRYLTGELLVSSTRWTGYIEDPDDNTGNFFSGTASTDRMASPDPTFSLTTAVSAPPAPATFTFSGIWHSRAFISGTFAPAPPADKPQGKAGRGRKGPQAVNGENGVFRALSTGIYEQDAGVGLGDPGHDVLGKSFTLQALIGNFSLDGNITIAMDGTISGSAGMAQGAGGSCTLSGHFAKDGGRNLYDVDMSMGGATCPAPASYQGSAYGETGKAFDGSPQEMVKGFLVESTGQSGIRMTLTPPSP